METNHSPRENGHKARTADHGSGGLSGVAIKRPVFTTMIMLGLIVLGIFGYRRLAIDQYPDVEFPVVAVQTIYPGASPETMEREVSRRMEEAFNTVQGIDEIQSNSLESVSLVIVQFDLDRSVDDAAQDIRAKIESIRQNLPADIEEPVVQKFDPSAIPIVSIALSSERVPGVQLTSIADETIRRRIESVRGVGEVRLAGGLEREIRIYVQPDRMRAVGVSIQEVMGALGRQNMEVPSGRVESGNREQLVRIMGRITDPRQFEQVIVANRNGQPIRLRDVARVEDATEEERSIAMLNDQRAIAMDIIKASGANTVRVADEVNAAIEELRQTLPEGVNLQIVRDNSVTIRQSVHDVQFELILGAILTVVVVMLFLNDWKATAVTSLALPVSIISTFILMSALGFTLNIITLLALALSIGILVDDAIVVIENIMRHRELGQDHFSASRFGTREIILAVMATTFSIVAVFVPVAFMEGIIGRFFYQFGLTVAWAVLVSLFVSFTLTPMLSAWWGIDPHEHGRRGNALTRAIAKFDVFLGWVIERYRATITWALGHRKLTILVATLAFVGSFFLAPFIGGEFFPQTDESQFSVTLETPEGSSLAYTRSKAEQIIRELRGTEGVDYVYTTIGAGLTGTVTAGDIYVKLKPAGERSQSQQEMMDVVRERLKRIYGVETTVGLAQDMGGGQAPLVLEIRGPDVDVLQSLSQKVLAEMQTVPGVVDLQSSMGDPRPEYRVNINREVANELGLDIGMIAATVRPLMAGQTATRWEDPSGEEREVVVQIDPASRVSSQNVGDLPLMVMTAPGATVPLSQIGTIEQGSAPAQIDRKNLSRQVAITGNVATGMSLSEASAAMQEKLDNIQLPPGYTAGFAGETEMLQETMGYVLETLILAIILIFLILASQFESFTQPIAIMLSLPLSLIGVLIALLLTGSTLNMMSMIGVIMLMGLVTKNAILLVDNANEQIRVHGKDRLTALIDAGAIRFRPIMMTTAAMIMGMLPVALAMGEGGGFRAPMARAVIGGLITSTALTLLVIPVAYTYFDDLGRFFKRKFVSKEREAQIKAERERSGLVQESVWGEEEETATVR